MSWDSPRNKSAGQRNVNVTEAQEESKEETKVNKLQRMERLLC